MSDEEIREVRSKALKDDLASINNRLHHAFNQGYELGRQSIGLPLKCLNKRLESLKSEYNAYHTDSDYWQGIKYAIDIMEVSK